MDYIDLSFVKYRGGDILNVENEFKWDEVLEIEKVGRCQLEMDTWPNEILNRYRVSERPDYAPLNLSSRNVNQQDERLISSLSFIWKDENKRRNLIGLESVNPTGSFSVDNGRISSNNVTSDQLNKKLDDLLNRLSETESDNSTEINYDNDAYKCIPTAFQAISALHPPCHFQREPSQVNSSLGPKIDIEFILSQKSEAEKIDLPDIDVFDGFSSQVVNDEEMIGLLTDMMEDRIENNEEELEEFIKDVVYDNIIPLPDVTPIKPQKTVDYISRQSSLKFTESRSRLDFVLPSAITPTISKKRRLDFTDPNSPLDSPPIKKRNKERIPQYDGASGTPLKNKRKYSERKRANILPKCVVKKKYANNEPEIWDGSFTHNTAWSPNSKRPLASYSFFTNPPKPTSPTEKKDRIWDGSFAFNNLWSPLTPKQPINLYSFFTDPPSNNSPTKEALLLKDNHSMDVTNIDPPISKCFRYPPKPPTRKDLQATLNHYNIPAIIYQEPFFSNDSDIPRKIEYGGKKIDYRKLKSIPEFYPKCYKGRQNIFLTEDIFHRDTGTISRKIWTLAKPPINAKVAISWLKEHESQAKIEHSSSQIKGATQDNEYGFKFTQGGEIDIDHNNLVILSMELHCDVRKGLPKDPLINEICCIFYCIQNGPKSLARNGIIENCHAGFIYIDDKNNLKKSGIHGYPITVAVNEVDLIEKVILNGIF